MERRRTLALAALGVLLVAATPVALPAEDTRERVYTYEAVEHETPESPHVAECDWHPLGDRECAVARHLADGNTIAVHSETGVSDEFVGEYEYVEVPEGYYRPVETVENHTVVLGLEPVELETVQRFAAENATEDPTALAAVENGTATTTDRLRETYVEHDGEFYRLRLHATDDRETNPLKRVLPAPLVALVRTLGYLGGFAAVWYSGVGYARGTGPE